MIRILDARKRALLCESALNRKVLEVELGQWHMRTARWEARASTAQKYWSFLSPIVHIFVPKKYSPVLSVVRALFHFRK
jgi:hypothetical protein